MADEIDKANELTEVLLTAAINNVRPKLIPNGKCFNCGEALLVHLKGSLFCDVYCREDYETQERIRKINGR